MSEHDQSTAEPVIVATAVAAGHDGGAEVALTVRYPNGVERGMSLPIDAIDRALDASGVATLAELVGKPWTTLAYDHPNPVRPSPPDDPGDHRWT